MTDRPGAQGGEQPVARVLTDADEVGLNTRLAFAVPLLRTLIQAVAESEGDWSFLNVRLASGPWVGVARRWFDGRLGISTNHGDMTSVPYAAEIHDVLVSHGFEFVPEHQGYLQLLPFDSDDKFEVIAKLMVGTFMHAWGASPGEYVKVELNISLPPEPADEGAQPPLE